MTRAADQIDLSGVAHTFKVGETIVIGGCVRITVLAVIGGGKAKLRIAHPNGMAVVTVSRDCNEAA